ncbi:MAG: cadmium-translocating P-type ATPase [Gammaproteobacteria bacterium]|nr:cadmium-translocating P-type ATPase [Gammaproteobacteria bacterium]
MSSAHLTWVDAASGSAETQFYATGMRCANCAGSIRSTVGALPGVRHVEVNLATARVSVGWDPATQTLDRVLDSVAGLGFRPVPMLGDTAAAARRDERRTALKRIGLAGLGSMQISMYALGLYAGAFSGIEADMARLLKVTSLWIALPVLLYSGAPFLRGALADIRRRSLGMDVPVAAALLLAFAASAFNTLRDVGQVYFDSVTMFIFFLLIGRYVEANMRRGSLDATEALARSLPASATRLTCAGGSERVALLAIRQGDRLLIATGAVIPVDGELETGSALIDESLVSGESTAVRHAAGATLPGGAVNVGAPLTLRARTDARGSMLASMIALMERAQSGRPRVALAADRAAAWFVGSILALALLVAGLWLWFDPAKAFEATLAVLVVTCPCALSLATPAAVAAATARLARQGVLVTRANSLEQLAGIDTVVLDKTGTLTTTAPRLGTIEVRGGLAAGRCAAIAAALERHSAHPLAAAFAAHDCGLVAADVREMSGMGLEGRVDGHSYRLGRHDFAGAAGAPVPAGAEERVWLGRDGALLAGFEILDTLRPDAAETVRALRAAGLTLHIASGDRPGAVARIAAELGIDAPRGRQTPADKIALVRALQADGHRVLMLGDGINDGPVLAAADVSCAMGQGAAVAHAAADMLLLGDTLAGIPRAVTTARGSAGLIRGNLRWALGYNLCAVPVAALGWVAPWVAAIGMSMSSLYVVWRAHRFAHAT